MAVDARCHTCAKKVHESELVEDKQRAYHRLCFKCVNCAKRLEPGRSAELPDGELHCASCAAKHNKTVKYDGHVYHSSHTVKPAEPSKESQDAQYPSRQRPGYNEYKPEPRPQEAQQEHDAMDEVATPPRQRNAKKRESSKRSSLRRSGEEEPDGVAKLIEQIKELCGCGRKTVRE
jgi:hypothetical protein